MEDNVAGMTVADVPQGRSISPTERCPAFSVPDDASLLREPSVGPVLRAEPFGQDSLPADEVWASRLVEDFDPDEHDQTPSFDDSVRLAAKMTGSPMAAVTLLDDRHQWFKAKVGVSLRGTSRDMAFCAFTIEQDDVFLVADAHADERFKDNPLVTGGPLIRAYAGVPLVMPNGARVGALCVLDTEPRDFVQRERQVLELLARQVVSQLQLEQLIHHQAQDIEDLRLARSEMREMAMHDELTGLLNRRGLISSIERMSTTRHPSVSTAWKKGVSVLFLDLDDFKAINDTRGHEIGDRVLVEIADRLQGNARAGDLIGRLGGDEFIVLAAGSNDEENAALAARLIQSVEQPMHFDGEVIVVEASIGVAPVERFGNVLEAIDHADRAMYKSKQAGGRGVSTWSEASVEALTPDEKLLRTVNKFVHSCVEDDRIRVHFQPMFDLSAEKLIRREALLRWRGDAPADVTVEQFIAVAEQIGLIGRIGRMVLEESCRAAFYWQATDPGVGVSVNVSALQVVPGLADVVAGALERSGLPPHLLTLELTETSLLEQTDANIAELQRVHELGVRLALDDFGTGYASMSMLCALPLDEVKIDHQFCSDPDVATVKVVRATVELGHSLGLCVVAEGIETREMFDQLVSIGCDVGQGYLLGKPAAY